MWFWNAAKGVLFLKDIEVISVVIVLMRERPPICYSQPHEAGMVGFVGSGGLERQASVDARGIVGDEAGRCSSA